MKVVVVGAGRLGRALVARLPADVEVAVVVRRPPAPPMSGRTVTVATDAAVARGAHVLVPAVPADDVVSVVAAVEPFLDPGTLVCNVATELPTPPLAERFPGLRIVATKVVGQAGELQGGSRGAVVVDGATDAELALLRRLFDGLGAVVALREDVVLAVNTAVGEEMVRAEAAARARLAALRLPGEVVDAALATMAVGALRAVATGTAGPFLRRIVERVRAKDAPAAD